MEKPSNIVKKKFETNPEKGSLDKETTMHLHQACTRSLNVFQLIEIHIYK